jgi:hypothetical protein
MGSLTEYPLSDLTSGSLGGGHTFMDSTLNSQARELYQCSWYFYTFKIRLRKESGNPIGWSFADSPADHGLDQIIS